MSPRALMGAAAGALALAGAAAGLHVSLRAPEAPSAGGAHDAARRQPALYCEFFDFMHKSVVASYDFAVDERAASPAFRLRAQVLPDESTVAFSGEQRPAWTYAVEDDRPTLIAPDAQTRIVLFGFQPQAAGILWGEAGVRNNWTRNLEGRCRQAYTERAMAGAIASAQAEKGSPR